MRMRALTELPPLENAVLPAGIRSRFVPGVNGLRMHVLEAGFEEKDRPCILLLHGFPELAYSWRKLMVPFAAAGFHVVAPDQRGYGRTTGWDADYDGDLAPFRLLNLVRDAFGLVSALGHRSVAAVVGHDFGAPVAAWCALVRPDVFRSVALMSAPFAGPPALPFDTDYSTRQANADMRDCPQGVHAFLRAYFHMKSADWRGNKPFRLGSWAADELAKMPTYYVMDLDKDMAATVAPEMPSAEQIAACRWLPERELSVYSAEYGRTGFQGGLNWYRCRTSGAHDAELQLFCGRTIDVPAMFIAGKRDWGIFQVPGSVERMQNNACTQMLGCHLIDGAGHWVQQEQPEQVSELLLQFLTQQDRQAASKRKR